MEHLSDLMALLFGAGVVFEITPIKINPISWLGKLINKETTEEIKTINDKIDKIQNQVNGIEYKNAMKDLADIRSRIIKAGIMIQKGENLDYDFIKSIQHDLDMYDYYKETYVYMKVDGRKVKINGEVETARELINEQAKKCERR